MIKKIKLLLIGNKSFISSNLYDYLKKKIIVKKISFETFKKKNYPIKSFTHICNCSLKKGYVNKKFLKQNDIDRFIIEKIRLHKIKYIFLSSRKVYKPKQNIKETGQIQTKENYSKNKIITEKFIMKNHKKNYLILRISNLIGRNNRKYRKVSYNFIDNYFKFKDRKKTIYYQNYFKDFLSIDQFNHILLKVIQNNLSGIYNISLGQKVFIDELLNALNKNKPLVNFKKIKVTDDGSFYLNNKKLLKKINIKLTKRSLLNYCYNI